MTSQTRWGKEIKQAAGATWRLAAAIIVAVTVTLVASPLGTAQSAGPAYQVFVPLAGGSNGPGTGTQADPRMPGMGVAGTTYPDLLNADWHYGYEWCGFHTPGCTPMVKFWEMPELCPEVLLVGNEPNGSNVAGGAVISPGNAAQKSRAIRAMCSHDKTLMIVGNVVQADTVWMQQYLNAGGVYDVLGVHCYAYTTADNCITSLTTFKNTFPSAALCVTEWDLLSKQMNPAEFERLMRFIMGLTSCSAVFTDKYQGVYWTWEPIYWLAESGGVLNARGQIFANR